MRNLLIPATVTLRTASPNTPPTPATVSWEHSGRPERRGRHGRPPSSQPRSVARVIDEWRYDGHWWELEVSRDYFLVELLGGVRLELYREGGDWWLAKMSD